MNTQHWIQHDMISRFTSLELLLRNQSHDSTEHCGMVTLDSVKIKYQVTRVPLLLLRHALQRGKAPADIFVQSVSLLRSQCCWELQLVDIAYTHRNRTLAVHWQKNPHSICLENSERAGTSKRMRVLKLFLCRIVTPNIAPHTAEQIPLLLR